MIGKYAALKWSHVSTGAVLAYWAAMLLGTHLPGSAVPETPYSDKTLHFTAYAGFAFLLAWAWATRRRFLWCGPVFAVLVAGLYGALDELTQTFIPGRFGDLGDWCYDLLGTLTGVAVFCVVEPLGRWAWRRTGRHAQ